MPLDPYDVLGIKHDATWSNIKNAYKQMLIQTHPDKMNGDARYFMMVHDAYEKLHKAFLSSKKERNAPKTKQKYDNKQELPQPKQMKNFTRDKFNAYFDKNRINSSNPYDNGYETHMSKRLNYQEDVEVAKGKQIYIPTQEIVMYKEPESLLSSKMLESVYHLGETEVNDFSCTGATDIMKAYCHTNGEPIDTATRYKNLDHIQQERSVQNFRMSEEDKKHQKTMERERRRLEQYRLNKVNEEDNLLNQRYINLHSRLQ